MSTTGRYVQQSLNKVAKYFYTNNPFIGIGGGTAEFAASDTNLNSGTEISASGFRKYREGGDTGSFIRDNNFSMKFEIGQSEPTNQPFVMGEVGLFENNGTDDSGAVLAKLNSPQTKDPSTRWFLRLGGSVKDYGDTQ